MIKSFLIVPMVALLMIGCREYHLYQYEPATTDILNGRLTISVIGMYGQNQTNDGKKHAEYGYPYSLQFILEMPYEYDIEGLRIANIELAGLDSGNIFTLPNVQSNKVNDPRATIDPDADARTVIVSIGGLTADRFKYEDYSLQATVAILGSGELRYEVISVSLLTNFKKQKRSDWFDKLMSV